MGRKMKKVLTVGVYDLLHIGHVRLFERAKACGDYLIVAVQESDFILKYKPWTKMVYSTEERMCMVGSLKYVDEVITYQDVDRLMELVDFDVFAKGPDQNHEGFQRAVAWCKSHGKEVVVVPRTEGISSTQLREQMRSSRVKPNK